SHNEAAAVPLAALTAWQTLRSAKIRRGTRVLVIGASGGVGHFATQIARIYDAEVTGVCSTRNIDLVKELGAHHIIDYTQTPVEQIAEQYDIVMDTVSHKTFWHYNGQVAPQGYYITLLPHVANFLVSIRTLGKKKSITSLVRPNGRDLQQIGEWIENGSLTPKVEKVFSPHQAAEAHEHLESGRTQGKIVMNLAFQGWEKG
ncbi:MAG: NAD(P)-dependent alcohol dehydrogenase, partial [Bacteroidia bacterium]|nr:NAD(P)-dependent alcohol dehydrogenase [Bacteroidia bacterium]